MARDATSRLYDVDQDSFEFQKMNVSKKYDLGVVTFRAKKGKLIDLHKLHESLWATRLSGGTRSGVIYLEVTARGDVDLREDDAILDVEGCDRSFILVNDVEAKPEDAKTESIRGAAAGRPTGATDRERLGICRRVGRPMATCA